MTLGELRAHIDSNDLNVAKHIGGQSKRTKQDLLTEVRRAHACDTAFGTVKLVVSALTSRRYTHTKPLKGGRRAH